MAITDDVKLALDELRATFPDSAVSFDESGDGGAWVTVDSVPTGGAFVQPATWAVFHVPYNYPESDVYPHFVRPDLARHDGQPLGEGFAQPVGCAIDGAVSATQISRRTNTLDADADNAAGKLLKVLRWMGER